MDTENIPLGVVLLYVGFPSRARALRVCKSWRKEGSRPALWTAFDARLVFRNNGLAKLHEILTSPRFAQLEDVNFECCQDIGDAEVELLLPLAKTLTSLNFNALHKVSPAVVQALVKKCDKLKSLSLYWHPHLGDDVLKAASRETLTELNVSGCQQLTDAGIAALKDCRNLKFLDITRCPKLTDEALKSLAGIQLTHLIAYADSNLTDLGFASLANSRSLTNLVSLDTCGARHLTSFAVAAVVRQAGNSLTSLNLSWCVAITDDAAVAIANHCHVLTLLSFHGIVNITDVAIKALASSPSATTLTTFDINGCKFVSDYRRTSNRLPTLFPNVSVWTVHR